MELTKIKLKKPVKKTDKYKNINMLMNQNMRAGSFGECPGEYMKCPGTFKICPGTFDQC